MALTRISTDGIKDGTITGVDLATNVDLVDNKKIRFGTGNDLAISHDGTNSIIDNTTGELRIQTDGTMRMMCTAFNVVDENNSDTIINAQSDGAVEIYYDNSKKFETTSFGAQFTDNVKFDNPDTAGRDVLWAADYDSMRWQDNTKATFGDSDDLQIYHNGTASFISNTTGDLKIDSDNIKVRQSNGNAFIKCQSTAVELYYADNKKFETTSTGITVSGSDTTGSVIQGDFRLKTASGTQHIVYDASNSRINFADNISATFGDSNDLQIYHDGSNSRLKNTTGSLWLQSDTGIRFTDADVNESMAAFYDNGAVELYYDGSKKFETLSGGVQITGGMNLSGNASFQDNNKVKLGTGDDLQIYHNGTASFISNITACTLLLQNEGNIQFEAKSGEDSCKMIPHGGVELYYDNSKKFETKSDGVQITDANPLLHIQGTGNSGDTAIFLDADDNHWLIRADNYGSQNTFSIKSGTPASSTHRLLINSSGHVLFNCTSLPSSSVAGAGFEKNGSQAILFSSSGSSTASSNHAEFLNGNGVVGTINTNGSATSYNTSSDYRLKENATAMSDGITRLKTLKPYRFNFKADADTTVDGFFAHEVQSVVPQAISGTKDEVDSDNNPIYQGIDQSKLVPLLVAAVQEAISKIEVLETEVAALKAS